MRGEHTEELIILCKHFAICSSVLFRLQKFLKKWVTVTFVITAHLTCPVVFRKMMLKSEQVEVVGKDIRKVLSCLGIKIMEHVLLGLPLKTDGQL